MSICEDRITEDSTEFKSTIGIERNVKKHIMRKL